MLSTAPWLTLLQRAKKGIETIHFAKFWQKGVEIRHFPSFCWSIGVKTKQTFHRPGIGGSKWRNICSIHKMSTFPRTRSPIRFQVAVQNNPPRPTQSHLIDCCNLLCNLAWGSAAVLQNHLQHLKENVCVTCVPDYVYMNRWVRPRNCGFWLEKNVLSF